MPQNLTPADRKDLKARAHALDPVVIIGDAGLTDGVMAEVDRSLSAHGLIKVRVTGDDRDARLAIRDRIADALGALAVQTIGKLLVFYREKPAAEAQPPRRRVAKKVARKVSFNPAYKVSPRKVKTAAAPPRSARVRKSGQRSAKKGFQDR
jgi:RNA-binding protein